MIRARAAAGREPARPIVLAFTADEEAGGHKGAEYLITEHRDYLADCTEAIGEVGGFSATVRGRRMYLIQAAEKGMAWMRLTAHGTAGHGSMRNTDNPVTRLAAAVARVGAHQWPVRLTPSMEVLLASVAELAGTEATPDNAEELIEEFGSAARMLSAVIRNSANPTVLDAGYKVNVVPGTASAQIDGRFLPGYEDEFFATMAELLGEGIEVDYLSRQHAGRDAVRGRHRRAMTSSVLAEDPDALVAPYLMSGGTDGKNWAKLGMRLLRVRAAAAPRRSGLHLRSSMASTSGCRSTPSSSAPGCSTDSSTSPDARHWLWQTSWSSREPG